MKQWNSKIFKENNIKLMKFHIVLALFYLSFALIAGYFFLNNRKDPIWMPILFTAISIIHSLLAYGSKQQFEVSRKASEFIGVILLAGFPIGTIIGYFFLQCTLWKDPEEKIVQLNS